MAEFLEGKLIIPEVGTQVEWLEVEASVTYSDIQLTTFRDRYAAPSETMPEEAWRRVADAVASVETDTKRAGWAERFYELQQDFKYVPGGRIIAAMGARDSEGNPLVLTAQNCYVIPSPEDSREGIMKSLGEWVEIQSKGGGVGVNISSLRPSGTPVKGVNGTSSGPVNWAQLFAFVTRDIIIQGGSRRGAAMIMINCDHPDVFEFIHAKEEAGKLEGCNMSVCISDSFMEAVRRDSDWNLVWGGRTYRTVKAKQIWDEINQAAWKSAEPGIYFMERANKEANSGYFEELISTNPCGEQPLGPYGACLLGSFNLRAYMLHTPDGSHVFDWDSFYSDTEVAVRFNDNVIDVSSYPLAECRESQQNIRRMGIGLMGLADVLIDMKMRYGSQEAIEFTGKVYETLRDGCYAASASLAAERGSFPKFDAGKYLDRPFIKRLPQSIRDSIQVHGIRNCYLLTQAPTGTIAQLSGVNGGIEPYFMFKTFRRDRLGEYWIKTEWADDYDSDDRPIYLVTADEISPEGHVLMQAAAQRYIDSSISKTANVAETATVQDIENLYTRAYDEGLKSLSVYRNNSRATQVLNKEDPNQRIVVNQIPKRQMPVDRDAFIHKFRVDEQEGYMTIGLYPEGNPGELFVNVSKQGGTFNGLMDTVAMLTSFCLQRGMSVEELEEKLGGTMFVPAGRTANPDIPFTTSIVDYIFRFMSNKYGGIAPITTRDSMSGELCPVCGAPMKRAEGCVGCPSCGYQKCG